MLIARIISSLAQVYVWVVIISVILSYFMDPYHPVRQGVDNLVRPLLDPIRRIVPPVGMFDFSPIILIILIQVVANVLINILNTIG
jgi:YggT family protein